MKFFSLIGLLFVVIGVFLAFTAYSMLNNTGATFKFFIAGPALLAIGIGMIFLPGPVTANQVKSKQIEANSVFKTLPMKNKVIWVVLGIIGLIVGNYILGI